MRILITLLLTIGILFPTSSPAQEPFDGPTLISLLTTNETYLIDLDLNILQTWTGTNPPATIAQLLPDGSIFRPCIDPDAVFGLAGGGGRLQFISADNVITWDYIFSDETKRQHHDAEPMPNGNVLVIAWERKTQAEAIAAGRQVIGGEMLLTMIAEIEPVGATGGNVVWEWHLWDHLIQDADPSKDNYGVVGDHPELVDINYGNIPASDWDHANAIDYNPELDQIVISVLKLNEFWIIDHSTTTAEAAGHTGGRCGHGGDLLYRWGNPQTYRRGDADDQYYFNVHGANWIDPYLPGAGNILTFNNGDRPNSNDDYSSVEEIVPPLQPDGNYTILPGEAWGPAAPVWSYSQPPGFYAYNRSGAYRLPNGNTLICETGDKNIFEVTMGGSRVWQYTPPAAVHRAPRYWYDIVGIDEGLNRRSASLQNHPNPFNPQTTITFEMPATGRVRLQVYDVTGRLVATPLDALRGAGPQEAVWDGRDLNGTLASSGVYFYRLTAPGLVQTSKMVLTK